MRVQSLWCSNFLPQSLKPFARRNCGRPGPEVLGGSRFGANSGEVRCASTCERCAVQALWVHELDCNVDGGCSDVLFDIDGHSVPKHAEEDVLASIEGS